jgi:hypothetical protein
VHTFQVRIFDTLCIDEFAVAPDSDFRNFVMEGVDAQVDLFSRVSLESELLMADRNSSAKVNGSIHSETEDIFR